MIDLDLTLKMNNEWLSPFINLDGITGNNASEDEMREMLKGEVIDFLAKQRTDAENHLAAAGK